MRSFIQLTIAALAPAALAGLVAGVFSGGHYLGAGFPLLFALALARALAATLAGAAVYVALFALLRGALTARLAPGWRTTLAAFAAAAPFVALAGYRLNRTRAVKPSEILEPWALVPNLLLLAAAFAACAVCAFLLHLWLDGRRRPPRWTAVAALATTAVLLATASIGLRTGQKTRPDVLVLLVDALRADELGVAGYARDTTPAIDALAKDGVVFTQAISQSTFTKTSIASLMTGRYPYRHGVYWGSRRVGDGLTADLLGEGETTVAEVFRDAGYLTAAWVQNNHLRRVMGFAQGFVDYHDQQGGITRIHRRFFPWLDGPGRRYPFFVYLHYIDLHDPYRPPPPYDTLFGDATGVYDGVDLAEWGAYLEGVREGRIELSQGDVDAFRALYDGQLRAVDDEIGRLLEKLRQDGRYDDTLIVLTADHGDAFMEHGFISHSSSPYEELIRVPLVVKLPENRFAGSRVDDQVRLVDLLPTLVSATGVEAELDVDGCDLVPWIAAGSRPEDAPERCSYAVVEIAEDDDAEPTLALRGKTWKLIHRPGGDELYHLVDDPGERTDLIAADPPPEAAELRRLAAELVERRARAASSLELDEKTIRQLKALGYVGD